MTGAFAKNEILFPGDAIESVLDFLDQHFVVGGLKVFAREIRFDGDWAHVHERTIELVYAVHQDSVFVYFLFGDFDEPLTDRFDVSNTRIMLLQRCNQAERGRSLAVILAGRRNEDAWSRG